jgi:hypothetical protein
MAKNLYLLYYLIVSLLDLINITYIDLKHLYLRGLFIKAVIIFNSELGLLINLLVNSV